MDCTNSPYSPLRSPLSHFGQANDKLSCRVKSLSSFASSVDELRLLPLKKLESYHVELNSLIRIYNEMLVQELAIRDELEYEKEVRNTFISLMSAIQSKKRKYHMNIKRKKKKNNNSGVNLPILSDTNGHSSSGVKVPQYLTTIVPYEVGSPMSNQTLECLNKILRAINEDNANVPTMLTDYILNVLCSSANK